MNEKHPSTCCPVGKHPKHSKFAITDIQEKPVMFLVFTSAPTLS